jgi:uncharacterized RDD family membrane protein YckC
MTDAPSARLVVFANGSGPHSAPLAQWWERGVAAVVDGVIVGSSLFFLLFIVFGLTRRSEHLVTVDHRTFYTSIPTAFIVASVLGALAGLAYFALLDGGTSGQTVGKRAMSIATADARTGGPIGILRAFLRVFICLLLWSVWVAPGVVDALWPLWSKKCQALHDYVARSVVVKVDVTNVQRAVQK